MMLNHPTLHTLHQLKLAGMADGFERQITQPATHDELSFDERLALLVDQEKTYRDNNKVTRLLTAAKLKLQANPEHIDYSHPRGLNKSQLAQLLSSQWIHQHHNVLIEGPTGCGKTYLACVLGTQAFRHGLSVRYFRVSCLLGMLPLLMAMGVLPNLSSSWPKPIC
ncbi:Insertion sequence IS5376 putative ATP-binding protein [Thalassocella blandensis]|nr:Insertion sequence IS5376 putative ATP-binding protein [Thalassocella blandensis]